MVSCATNPYAKFVIKVMLGNGATIMVGNWAAPKKVYLGSRLCVSCTLLGLRYP